MNRRLLAIFAAILLTASLCACREEQETNESGSKDNIIIDTTSGTDTSDETESGNKEDTTNEIPVTDLKFVDEKGTVYTISPTGAVNLRSEPVVADSTKKDSVENGTELQKIAVSEDGSWTKVVYDGQEYYIKSAYLTTLKNLDEGFTAVSKTLTMAGSLYVRVAPSMDNEAIDTLNEGDKIEVIAENTETGWYKIKFDGTYAKEGYIASDAKYFVQDAE